ncbi:SWAP/Surp [Arabidopsis thaliana x Arabidopsis arenosa]|uniref:SWAP/Surp n=1 Tax=Arabidopsis thaliana x Arabidopsis arenosa TaxID=1240361 RepID=A0A8T1YWC0_9BRAS|nr:SWAP/Surp [Arabidopsis thaliana x Arabidopsis arenosa]
MSQNDVKFLQPPPEIRKIVKKTARLVAQKGLEFEDRIMSTYVNHANFSFLRSSDPFHSFYQHTLSKYRPPERPSFMVVLLMDIFHILLGSHSRSLFLHHLQLEKLEEGVDIALIDLLAFTSGVDCFTYMEDDYFPISLPPPDPLSLIIKSRGMLDDRGMLVRTDYHGAQSIHPDAPAAHDCVAAAKPSLEFSFLGPPPTPLSPAWITLKELGYIKLTAMFAARYGMDLLKDVVSSMFEFMNPTHSWFYLFNLLVDAYSRVIRRPLGEPKKRGHSVVECFSVHLQVADLCDGVDKGMIDLHAFVGGVDCFAHMEDEEYSDRLPPPVHLSVLMNQLKQMQPPLGSQLTEYRPHSQDGPQDIQPDAPATQLDLVPLRDPPLEPRNRAFTLPAGITLKELGIIKFTALFVARYGEAFRQRLVTHPQFEFLKPTDGRFCFFFYRLVHAYSRVLRLSKKMRKNDFCQETVLNTFFHRLQLEKLDKGVEMAMIDLHAFVDGVDCFARMEDEEYAANLPPPEHLSMLMKQLKHLQPPLGSQPLRPHDTASTNTALISLKKIGICMLAAQFVARYGMDLMEIVVANPQFEFMEPTNSRFYSFNKLVDAYSGILKPSRKLKKSDAFAATVVECFFNRLQLDKLEEGVEMAVIDLHAFVGGVDYFTVTCGGENPVAMPAQKSLSKLMTRMRPGMLVHPPLGSQLTEYRAQKQDGATDECYRHEPPPSMDPPLSSLCRLSYTLPDGIITLKEIGILKLTAQFVVRYGMDLMRRVVSFPQLVFMEPTNSWFPFFNKLVDEYSRVLKPSGKQGKSKFDKHAGGVIDCFLHRLQLDKLEEGVEMAMVDLHAFVSGVDYFIFMEDDYNETEDEECSDHSTPPEHFSMLMNRITQMQPGITQMQPGMLVGSQRTEDCGAQSIHPDAPATHECVGDAQPDLERTPPRPLHSLALAFPAYLAVKGFMTVKELGTMKLTAQFVARYGMDSMKEVAAYPRFEFMVPTHSFFRLFNELVDTYSRVLEPSKKLWKKETSVVDLFFYRLQFVELEDGVEMAMIDLHASVSGVDCFTHMEEYMDDEKEYSDGVSQPEHLSVLINLLKKQPGILVRPPASLLGSQKIQPDAQHEEPRRKRQKHLRENHPRRKRQKRDCDVQHEETRLQAPKAGRSNVELVMKQKNSSQIINRSTKLRSLIIGNSHV